MKLNVFDTKKGKVRSFEEKESKPNIPKGKACSGKIKHKSLLASEEHLERIQKISEDKKEIYKCGVCKFYHIGHKKNKTKK